MRRALAEPVPRAALPDALRDGLQDGLQDAGLARAEARISVLREPQAPDVAAALESSQDAPAEQDVTALLAESRRDSLEQAEPREPDGLAARDVLRDVESAAGPVEVRAGFPGFAQPALRDVALPEPAVPVRVVAAPAVAPPLETARAGLPEDVLLVLYTP